MQRMLISASQPDELAVAITDESQLINLDIDHPGQKFTKSNIYKGKISSIEPSLGAVFVDYGMERHGFLPLKEISKEYFLQQDDDNPSEPDIRKILKLGQELVVQVEKEERGTKGAALTTFISLAGSFLVLMPNNPRAGGISRRIEGEERDNLRETIDQLKVPEGMGVIIRTAGVGRNSDELKWDLDVLLSYWEAIKQAAVVKPGPYLIHQESDAIIRAVRDYLRQDIEEIIIDEPKAFERAKTYIAQVRPSFAERIKLYNDHLPLFSRFQIEQQIEAAYQREVRLPSGGSIVIDMTEALVAVDINSARATKGGNIEETALNTNLEAADEIARQLRIRDVGGLVVIDFIDMTPIANQKKVEARLRQAFHIDRARIQMGRISRFGLLEMSRQRLRSSLSRAIQVTCPRCEGHGTIRAVESIASSIIHLIQENAAKAGKVHLQLQVQLPVDVATYILNEKRDVIEEVQRHSNLQALIIPNPHLQSPHYQIKQVRLDPNVHRMIPSYKLMRITKENVNTKRPYTKIEKTEEPVINEFLSQKTPQQAMTKKTGSNGLIKRLWDIMFGTDSNAIKATPNRPQRQASQQHRESQHNKRTHDSRKPPREQNRSSHHHRGDKTGTRSSRNQSSPRGEHGTSHPNKPRTRRGTRGGQRRSPQHDRNHDAPRSTHHTNQPHNAADPMHRDDNHKPAPSRHEQPSQPPSNIVEFKHNEPTPANTKPQAKTTEQTANTQKPETSRSSTPAPTPTKNTNYRGFGHSESEQLEQVKTKHSKSDSDNNE